MTKEIEEAYVAGWQTALEQIMSTIEDGVRQVVLQFQVPEEFATKKSDLIIPEKKLVLPE